MKTINGSLDTKIKSSEAYPMR